MSLKMSVAEGFARTMNPCEFRPYYAEDCTKCMDKFCKDHKTTREEYRRKKTHANLLRRELAKLEKEILDDMRVGNGCLARWRTDTLVALEKELEIG